MGEGVSTCACNCLQLGVQPGQLEVRGVPGGAPVLGLAPGCGEAAPGPLPSASRSPHIGQTAGPGSGSAPAQRGPGWGLSPLPSPRSPPHTGQLAGDSLGAPLLGGEWVGGSGSGFYSPWNILRTVPWKKREEGPGLLFCQLSPRGPSLLVPPHLDSSSSPHPRLLSPVPIASFWSSLLFASS